MGNIPEVYLIVKGKLSKRQLKSLNYNLHKCGILGLKTTPPFTVVECACKCHTFVVNLVGFYFCL